MRHEMAYGGADPCIHNWRSCEAQAIARVWKRWRLTASYVSSTARPVGRDEMRRITTPRVRRALSSSAMEIVFGGRVCV